MKLVQDNILAVRYLKTKQYVSRLKPILISEDTKHFILNIIDGKFDTHIYSKLEKSEQRIVNTFVKCVHLSYPIIDTNKEENNHFQVLLGEYRAGNSSIQLKTQIKKYIIMALSDGLIPRNQGYQLLYELSL